jgi:3-deoxy-7-phosphoheptulonate synthase
MIIVMNHTATETEIEAVSAKLESLGFKARRITGEERSVIGAVGKAVRPPKDLFSEMAGVAEVVEVSKPYKIVAREFKEGDTIVQVGRVPIGGRGIAIIAGPCAVESRAQILEIAQAVKEAGGHLLRGGAFKPRTSPYSFQGLGEQGLEFMAEAREKTGLGVVTEIVAVEDLPVVTRLADLVQVGARNMQNFNLLKKIGREHKPVLIKRGMACTIEEMLMSAEYVASEGNEQIVLCERGVRTFETATRFTLDLNAIPVVKRVSHLPILADPSHGTGHRGYVAAMAQAAVAGGADGLLVEVHPDPDRSISDSQQTITIPAFRQLVKDLRQVARAVGRDVL